MRINDELILENTELLENKFKENFINDDKTLIVVDVQEEFSKCFSDDYLNDLKEYINANEFEQIIAFVDVSEGSAAIPFWLKNKVDIIIEKSYFSPSLKYIKSTRNKFKVIEKNRVWKNKDGEIIIATDNEHETFKIPEKLISVAPTIKNAILIGGAYSYCIEDIHMALKYLKIPHEFNYELVYNDEICEGVYECDWDIV